MPRQVTWLSLLLLGCGGAVDQATSNGTSATGANNASVAAGKSTAGGDGGATAGAGSGGTLAGGADSGIPRAPAKHRAKTPASMTAIATVEPATSIQSTIAGTAPGACQCCDIARARVDVSDFLDTRRASAYDVPVCSVLWLPASPAWRERSRS